MSTQWDTRGHYYPIQIAQFGLSHFSKNLTESAPSCVCIEDGETTLHGKWLYSKHNRFSLKKIYDTVSGSTVLEFKTKGKHTLFPVADYFATYNLNFSCGRMITKK